MSVRIYIYVLAILVASCDSGQNNGHRQTENISTKQIKQNASEQANHVLYQKVYEGTANTEELLKVFRLTNINDLANLISVLNKYKDDPKVVDALKKTWLKDNKSYPDFSWNTLEEPAVRVSIAQVLYRITNENIYKEYIYSLLENKNVSIREAAVRNIGIIGNNSDISLLENIIRSDTIFVATSAMVSLRLINTEESITSLQKLKNSQEVGREKQSAITQILESKI